MIQKENTPSGRSLPPLSRKGNLKEFSSLFLKFPFFKRGGCEADGVFEVLNLILLH